MIIQSDSKNLGFLKNIFTSNLANKQIWDKDSLKCHIKLPIAAVGFQGVFAIIASFGTNTPRRKYGAEAPGQL